MQKRGIDVAATLCLLIALICWSVVPLVLRYLTDVIPDGWTTNAVRYPVAAMMYAPLLFFTAMDRASRRLWLVALVPAIPNIVGQSLFAWSPYFIDPGLMSFIVRLSVLWGIGLSLIVFAAERRLLQSSRFWLGVALSLAGFLAVALCSNPFAQRATLVGIMIAIGCSFFWGVYGITVRLVMGKANPLTFFGIVCVWSSIGCLAVSPLGQPSCLLHLPGSKIVLLVVSAFIGIAAAHGLYYIALQRLGTTIPSAVNALTPFVTAVASSYLFREQIAPIQWIGGIGSLIGTALILWSQEHLHASETTVEY